MNGTFLVAGSTDDAYPDFKPGNQIIRLSLELVCCIFIILELSFATRL